ncbi:CapA family protein [Cohnella lubricantis]|uniref:CapA family protein n=1 Tax=Cohnella lubricantis TaxID=2163172 RepID=A0A841TM24_9BACL|nr:CapA family protein [Cohnella lubricantis]MBB6679581.1 CapA family protein [Cohnella lubricantis]MBP2120570.1 poly-gamma-glutamate synthesis protein (capsule biosynthesis protein) [Cohnella lubricantis]
MSYSRTRTHQISKKRRFRKLLFVNVTLLALIVVAGGLLAAQWSASGGVDGAPGGRSEAPPASAPAAGNADEPSGSGNANGTPTDPGNAGDASNGTPTGSDSDAPGTPDEPAGGPADTQDQVTLAFVGDILTASTVGSYMDKNGVDYPFEYAAASLQAADITAGNLETPITNREDPAENKTYVFRGKPEYLTGIKNAGFDVLSLANNHTLDHGWEGLSDTMDYLDDAELQHMGSGVDAEEAFTPVIIESHGIRVAYIGVTHVVPDGSWKAGENHPGLADTYNTKPAVAAIQSAKELADIIVVMVHWGNEREQQPEQAQFDVGHTFVDAGADLVIGSHPHVLQGFEYYNGKWIAYSLGNFIFTTNGNSVTQQTGVLKAACTKDGACGMNFEPMFAHNFQPSPMKPEEGALLLAELSDKSYGAKVDEKGDLIPVSAGGGKETP